jgi:two-component system phosphate regulon response regulator PhoB
MTKYTILVVEDEDAIREMLVMVLEQADLDVTAVASAEQAQCILADQTKPDLMVLDWMLPGISGVDLARRLKQDPLFKEIPIILLTARDADEDKVRGLDIGADDYVTKPFSPKELVARIKAVLRRSGKKLENEILKVSDILLDVDEHRTSISGQSVVLSPIEFKLLYFFMTHENKVYARSHILDQVWGRNAYVEERTVDVHIRRLRKVLEAHGKDQLIQTVRGFGYRFSLIK